MINTTIAFVLYGLVEINHLSRNGKFFNTVTVYVISVIFIKSSCMTYEYDFIKCGLVLMTNYWEKGEKYRNFIKPLYFT